MNKSYEQFCITNLAIQKQKWMKQSQIEREQQGNKDKKKIKQSLRMKGKKGQSQRYQLTAKIQQITQGAPETPTNKDTFTLRRQHNTQIMNTLQAMKTILAEQYDGQ